MIYQYIVLLIYIQICNKILQLLSRFAVNYLYINIQQKLAIDLITNEISAKICDQFIYIQIFNKYLQLILSPINLLLRFIFNFFIPKF